MKVNINWNMCRVCLTEINSDVENRNIFDIDEDKIEISRKISECSGFEVKKEGILPEIICKQCIKHLNIAYKFRTTCKITNERLQAFVNKTNEFLLSGALEMTESLEVPEIVVDENLDESKIDYEGDTDFVEYIVEEDNDIEQNQIEEDINKETEFSETSTINYVALLKDSMLEKAVTPNVKYTVKSILDKTNLEPANNIITTFKIENDSLLLDTENKIGEQNDQFYELQINDPELNKPQKTRRKYTKRDQAKSFSCDICGNKFKHKYSLDIHMRLHTNEKPFVCEICNKDFALNFQLSRHMRIHTGEKPYSCKYCDRKFRDISTRIKHERIHTNERPFKCPYCPKDFIYSDVCKRHIVTHTGEKPYECIQCNKKFAQSYHLKAHLMTLSHKAQCEQVEIELFETDPNVSVYVPTFNTSINEEHSQDLIEQHEVITLH